MNGLRVYILKAIWSVLGILTEYMGSSEFWKESGNISPSPVIVSSASRPVLNGIFARAVHLPTKQIRLNPFKHSSTRMAQTYINAKKNVLHFFTLSENLSFAIIFPIIY